VGSWSPEPFDNDIAMDWVGELGEQGEQGAGAYTGMLAKAIADYAAYEARRREDRISRVVTVEEVERLISNFKRPLRGRDAEIIRRTVGQVRVDVGLVPAHALVAAGAVLRAAHANDRRALPDDLDGIPLASLAAPLDVVREVLAGLRALLDFNRKLATTLGIAWKRRVVKLADDLAVLVGEAAAPKVAPGSGPRERARPAPVKFAAKRVPKKAPAKQAVKKPPAEKKQTPRRARTKTRG
jgi:hypothetical protein